MKKFLVWLIALVMVLTMLPMAFASEGELVDGDNEIELLSDADEASVYTYTATQSGTLYIIVTEFYSSYKGGEYEDNMGTIGQDWWATELRVDGDTLEGGYYGSVEVEAGETYEFEWDHTFRGSFSWLAFLNLSYTDDLMPQFGRSEEYPIVIYPDDCPMETIKLDPGETAYYILEDFDGATFVVEGRDMALSWTYQDLVTAAMVSETIPESGGELSIQITSSYQKIEIINDGNAARRFDMYYYYPEGSRQNPVPMELGENVAYTIADNYDGFYFSYVVEEDGMLYLEFSEDNCWRYRVINLSTDDWYDEVLGGDEDAENPAEIYVEKWDELLIIVNSYDPDLMIVPGGAVYFTAYIGHEHVYGEGEVTYEPEGCMDEGEITYTCELCGGTYVETFPGTHVADAQEEGYEATCSTDGMLPYWYCASCEGYFSDAEMTVSVEYEDLLIPATGLHEDADGEWDVDEDGHYHLCECGEIFDQEAHAGGEATCLELAICDVCGAEYGDVDAENHRDTELRDEEEATCSTDGYSGDLYCNDCGEVVEEGQVIDATGDHVDADGEWDVDEDGHYLVCDCGEVFDAEQHEGGEATCSELAICDVCEAEYGEYDEENHRNTELLDEEEPTCATDGYTGDLYCNDCGELVEEGEVIEATGDHVDADGEWDFDQDMHYYECECGEIFDEEEHFGGTATCCEQAVCEVCGERYGDFDSENHLQTELRDQVGETCATDGYTGNTYCNDCGELVSEGETIPATGNHTDADGKWDVEGENHYHLCQCGEVIDKAAHSGGTATCDAKAVCAVCGTEYGELDSSNHGATEIRDAKAETCSAEGFTGDTYCTDCGAKVSDGTVIPANGNHTDADGKWDSDADSHWHICDCGAEFDKSAHTYGAWEIITEAGEEDGLMRRTCVCGQINEAVIPAQHTHSYETVVTAPTCYENGYTTHTCACGYYYISDEVPGGHEMTEIGEAKETSCAESGMLAYWYCGVCQTYFADEAMTQATTREALTIPALEHSYETVVIAPTCYESGYTTYTCTACGASHTADEVPPVHVEDRHEAAVEATCTEPGRKAYWHCQLCDGYFTDEAMTASATWEELAVPAKDHTPGAWIVVKEAEVGIAGLQQRSCEACGAVLEEEELPALETTPATTPAPTTAPSQATAPSQTTAPAQTTIPGGQQEPENNAIIVIVVVAVLAAAAGAVVLIIKKRK